jgi:hypothetical protein
MINLLFIILNTFYLINYSHIQAPIFATILSPKITSFPCSSSESPFHFTILCECLFIYSVSDTQTKPGHFYYEAPFIREVLLIFTRLYHCARMTLNRDCLFRHWLYIMEYSCCVVISPPPHPRALITYAKSSPCMNASVIWQGLWISTPDHVLHIMPSSVSDFTYQAMQTLYYTLFFFFFDSDTHPGLPWLITWHGYLPILTHSVP